MNKKRIGKLVSLLHIQELNIKRKMNRGQTKMGNQPKDFTLMRKRYISLFAVILTLVITSLALGAPMILSSFRSATGILAEPVGMILFGAGLLGLAGYGRKKIPK